MSKKTNNKSTSSSSRKVSQQKRAARASSQREPVRVSESAKGRGKIIIAILLACVCGIWGTSVVYKTFDFGGPETKYNSIKDIPNLEEEIVVAPAPPSILYPAEGTLFPLDMAPPTFRFTDSEVEDGWSLKVEFHDGGDAADFDVEEPNWTPSLEDWEMIKSRSLVLEGESPLADGFAPRAVLKIRRRDASDANDPLLSVGFSTAVDPVGAPIFYREVNLPFLEAVLDPSAHIRWRFGSVSSSEQPPVVLDQMPMCGNCHSFSADGAVMGMDVDYGDDKGSYAICPVEPEIALSAESMMSWSAFEPEDDKKTFGLLSQVSPNGRYAISTVKDQSVFIPVDNLEFSQLFFPIQGVLAFYDRETDSFASLSGADDGRYVQSNACWRPDGEEIAFARSEAYEIQGEQASLFGLSRTEEVAEFLDGSRDFKYDLYRVPFNDGEGGEAEPVLGASDNGMSNYFPKYSPDGRWIVFCRAENFMLLQPDSELYIVPAEGGEARRLECNTSRMNSWHSWSPNGKWLVFSSKANSIYTQLMLTHIDDEGRSSPPVCLSWFCSDSMAANIPEFVNTMPDAIASIQEDFISDESYIKVGKWCSLENAYDLAANFFQKAAEFNPNNAEAYSLWGYSLTLDDRPFEGINQQLKALELAPENVRIWCRLATTYRFAGENEKAAETYKRAIEIDPDFQTNHFELGQIFMDLKQYEEAVSHFQKASDLSEPNDGEAHDRLGDALFVNGRYAEAVEAYREALDRQPDSVLTLINLATACIIKKEPDAEDIEEAVRCADRACELSGYRDPIILMKACDVMAPAGEVDQAIANAQRALEIARAMELDTLEWSIYERIVQLENGETAPPEPQGPVE
jgi:tetratricopeptide (TPR) repeat protein